MVSGVDLALPEPLQEDDMYEYPCELIGSASQPSRERKNEEDSEHTLHILYLVDIGEDLRRVCR